MNLCHRKWSLAELGHFHNRATRGVRAIWSCGPEPSGGISEELGSLRPRLRAAWVIRYGSYCAVVKILIVDDDRAVASLLIQALSPKHSVIGITGGSHVVEWVKHRGFDLVLLDLLLPDSNGLALLPQLKSACPDVSVILMTGLNTPVTADEARSAGAEYFLTKPIDLKELFQAVQHLEDSRP